MIKRVFSAVYLIIAVMLWTNQAVNAQDLKEDKGYKEQLASIESQLQRGDIGNALESIEETIAKYPKGAETYYAKSLLYAQARNFDVALPAAEEAVALAPKNLIYNNHLLELYKSKGDIDGAVALLDKVIEQYPDNQQVYREKIMVLHSGKRSEDALKTAVVSQEKFGESDTLDVLKAEILMDTEKPKEAVALLSKWRNEKSPIRQIYSSLSYIYGDEGKTKDAITVLNEGITNSKDPLLYFDLADVYTNQNKSKQAFEYIKKAFELKEVNFIDKHRVMSQILVGEGNFSNDQKQELANILVMEHPRLVDAHLFKGDVLWQKGELVQAKSIYQTAVTMQPQYIDAWRKLVTVELANNDMESAIADGKEGLKHNPGNIELTYLSGVAYMMKKDLVLARQFLENALDRSENANNYLKAMIYSSLGDLYHEIKMESASDVAYEEAIVLDSTNSNAMNNYAYYLSLRKKNLDKAATYAKLANEIDPNSGTFQDTYAWVLFQQGKYQEALVWMQKSILNSKPSAVMYDHYGDILFKVGKEKEAIKQWQKALDTAANSSVDQEKLKKKISEKKYIE